MVKAPLHSNGHATRLSRVQAHDGRCRAGRAAAAAVALATGADTACQACHAFYRAQDPETGDYSVNLGPG